MLSLDFRGMFVYPSFRRHFQRFTSKSRRNVSCFVSKSTFCKVCYVVCHEHLTSRRVYHNHHVHHVHHNHHVLHVHNLDLSRSMAYYIIYFMVHHILHHEDYHTIHVTIHPMVGCGEGGPFDLFLNEIRRTHKSEWFVH